MVNKEKIIFGTWPISGDFTHKYELEKGLYLLNYALKKGIYNFDTAPNYGKGNAESLLGHFIKNHPKKCSNHLKDRKFLKNIKSFDYENILTEMENSIKRLNKIQKKFYFIIQELKKMNYPSSMKN